MNSRLFVQNISKSLKFRRIYPSKNNYYCTSSKLDWEFGGATHAKKSVFSRKVYSLWEEIEEGKSREPSSSKSNPFYDRFRKSHVTSWHEIIYRIVGSVDEHWRHQEISPEQEKHVQNLFKIGRRKSEIEDQIEDRFEEDLLVLRGANIHRVYVVGINYFSSMLVDRQMNLECAKQGIELCWVAFARKLAFRTRIEVVAKRLLRFVIRASAISKEENIDLKVVELLCKSCSVTQFKSAVAMLKKYPELHEASPQVVPAVICSCFRNRRPDLAMKIFERFYPLGKRVTHEQKLYLWYVYHTWILVLPLSIEHFLKFLTHVKEREICFNQILITIMKQYCDKLQKLCPDFRVGSIYTPNVCHNAICTQCSTKLDRPNLTTSDYKILLETCEKMIMESCQKMKPMRVDFDRTKKLLEGNKFKVVVDGLNIFGFGLHNYAPDNRCYHPQKMALSVSSLCKTFDCIPSEIVVVFKKLSENSHILKPLINDLQPLVNVHLVNYRSEDDLIILYLALINQPDCYLITRDHLNQMFKSLPNDESRAIFWKFMTSKQSFVSHSHDFNPEFQEPPNLDFRIQKHGNNWHIPLSYPSQNFYCNPTIWTCLQFPQENLD